MSAAAPADFRIRPTRHGLVITWGSEEGESMRTALVEFDAQGLPDCLRCHGGTCDHARAALAWREAHPRDVRGPQ